MSFNRFASDGPDGNVYIGERLAPGVVGLIARFDGLTGEYLTEPSLLAS